MTKKIELKIHDGSRNPTVIWLEESTQLAESFYSWGEDFNSQAFRLSAEVSEEYENGMDFELAAKAAQRAAELKRLADQLMTLSDEMHANLDAAAGE